MNPPEAHKPPSPQRPLRVLIVEDTAADAELVIAILKRAGYPIEFEVVDSTALFQQRLSQTEWDLILSDHNLRTWTGMDALDIVRRSGRDTPFVLVTASLGDEAAVEYIKQGAADYVLKDHIARLPFAIRRSLEEKSLREERQQAGERLRLQAAALEAAANGILITDRSGTITWANPAMTALTGYTPQELVGQNPRVLQSGDHFRALYEKLWSTITSGRVWSGEMVNRRKDGSTYTEEMTITPVRDSGGEITHFIAIKQDVTERRRAEAGLQEREQQLRLFVEHSPAAIAMFDCEMRYVVASRRWLTDYRIQDQNIIGRSHYEVFPEIPERWKEIHRRCLAGAVEKCEEDPFPRTDGTTDWIRWEVHPWHTAQGNIGGLIIFSEVVTERKRAEEALRESEARYREQLAELEHIYSTAPVGLALLDCEFRYLRINEQLAAMDGRSPEEHIGRTMREVIPEVADKVEPLLRKLLTTGEPVIGIEVTTPDPQTQKPRVALVSYYPLKGEDGSVRAINTVVLDVTERQLMGKQIATLQKFEAIGQLAGGIAHDFNNVIGTMLGWAEIGMEEAEPGSRLYGHFEKICDQSKRAAGLTRQLLAFARQQILEPRNLSLNQVVTDLTNFLRKAIPETIELKLTLAPDLHTIRADQTQLEQILMNLCLNARDAMAARADGRLTVETSNVEIDDEYGRFHLYAKPGRYALLVVSDNGTGMDAATQEHIFEPFFTTKEVGQGTGLGLATVYGIVKQHGGFINVYSEPGHGTTFRVYLPVVEAVAEELKSSDAEPVRGGSETILVAEDHEGGRQMICETLRKLGYAVLAASNGEEAVRIFKENRKKVDLLLFDVVMPKLSGPEAFERIEAIRPGLPVIFATGYSSEADVLSSLTAEHRHLVQKPYSPRAIACKVRELLDQAAAPAP